MEGLNGYFGEWREVSEQIRDSRSSFHLNAELYTLMYMQTCRTSR
jgi:hypothetical protein